MGASATSFHLSLSGRHMTVSHCGVWTNLPFGGTVYKSKHVKHGGRQPILWRSIAVCEGDDFPVSNTEDGKPPLLSRPLRTPSSRNGNTFEDGRRRARSLPGGERGKEHERNSFRHQPRRKIHLKNSKGRVSQQSTLAVPSTDRWLTNLAAQICDLLKNVTADDPFVDATTARELLSLLPPPLLSSQSSIDKIGKLGGIDPKETSRRSAPNAGMMTTKQNSEGEEDDCVLDTNPERGGTLRVRQEKDMKNNNYSYVAPPFLSEGTFVNLLNLLLQKLDNPGVVVFSLYNIITRSHRMKEVRKSYKGLAISGRVLSTIIELLGREEYEQAGLECLYRGLCLDGGDASRRGSWKDVWTAFSFYRQPELVIEVMEKAKSAGIVPGSDAITCLVRSHELNGDAIAAARALKHFGIEGLSPPVEALASVGRAAVDSSNYSLANKVISWTNILLAKDAENKSLVYREMLVKSFSCKASHDMRSLLIEQMKSSSVKLSCLDVQILASKASHMGLMEYACGLFSDLRRMGLVKDLPLAAQHLWTRSQQSVQASEMYKQLVLGAQKSGLLSWVNKLFDCLRTDNVQPTAHTVSKVVKCFPAQSPDYPKFALEVYKHARVTGAELDAIAYRNIINALLSGSWADQYWDTAFKLLHRMHMGMPGSNDTSVQTSMAMIAGRKGGAPLLLRLYNLMLQDGVMPANITWNAFINASVKSNNPKLAFAFREAMKSMGVPADVPTHSSLLSAAAALKDIDLILRQWNEILEVDRLQPDPIACSTFMWACLTAGHPELAAKVFEKWREDGSPPCPKDCQNHPGNLSYASVVRSCVKSGRWKEAKSAVYYQRWLRLQGVDPENLYVEDLRVKAKSQRGNWENALNAYYEAEKMLPHVPGPPDGVSVAFAVTAYGQLGDMQRAHDLAEELADMELPSTSIAYCTAIDACGSTKAGGPAMRLLQRAKNLQLRLDPSAYTSSLTAIAETGEVTNALHILDLIVQSGGRPNPIICNATLNVCAGAGDAVTAMHIFNRMRQDWRLQADEVTMATLVEVLGKAGQWGSAIRLMAALEREGVYRVARPGMDVDYGFICSFMAGISPLSMLDLHGATTVGTCVVLRAWFLLLKYSDRDRYWEGDALTIFRVVTGRGKNSKDGVSKIRPTVIEFLEGNNIGFTSPSDNPGALVLDTSTVIAWINDPDTGIGLEGGKEEEMDIWLEISGQKKRSLSSICRGILTSLEPLRISKPTLQSADLIRNSEIKPHEPVTRGDVVRKARSVREVNTKRE